MAVLSRVRIHPIKSCRGFDCDTAELDELGLVGDRRFQVVNERGVPFTQRSHSELARVNALYDGDQLVVSAAKLGEVRVARYPSSGPKIETEVWSTSGLQADDCGEDAGQFFSALLKEPARLITAGKTFDRPVKNNPDDRVGFADAFPLLVISEASLADLNARVETTGSPRIEMECFRPNLVINDCAPYAEDTWDHVTIGSAEFVAGGPCERCIMTTLDPTSGARRGPEPLRTLAQYRRAPDGSGVWFGQNLVNATKAGTLRVGEQVVPA